MEPHQEHLLPVVADGIFVGSGAGGATLGLAACQHFGQVYVPVLQHHVDQVLRRYHLPEGAAYTSSSVVQIADENDGSCRCSVISPGLVGISEGAQLRDREQGHSHTREQFVFQ